MIIHDPVGALDRTKLINSFHQLDFNTFLKAVRSPIEKGAGMARSIQFIKSVR